MQTKLLASSLDTENLGKPSYSPTVTYASTIEVVGGKNLTNLSVTSSEARLKGALRFILSTVLELHDPEIEDCLGTLSSARLKRIESHKTHGVIWKAIVCRIHELGNSAWLPDIVQTKEPEKAPPEAAAATDVAQTESPDTGPSAATDGTKSDHDDDAPDSDKTDADSATERTDEPVHPISSAAASATSSPQVSRAAIPVDKTAQIRTAWSQFNSVATLPLKAAPSAVATLTPQHTVYVSGRSLYIQVSSPDYTTSNTQTIDIPSEIPEITRICSSKTSQNTLYLLDSSGNIYEFKINLDATTGDTSVNPFKKLNTNPIKGGIREFEVTENHVYLTVNEPRNILMRVTKGSDESPELFSTGGSNINDLCIHRLTDSGTLVETAYVCTEESDPDTTVGKIYSVNDGKLEEFVISNAHGPFKCIQSVGDLLLVQNPTTAYWQSIPPTSADDVKYFHTHSAIFTSTAVITGEDTPAVLLSAGKNLAITIQGDHTSTSVIQKVPDQEIKFLKVFPDPTDENKHIIVVTRVDRNDHASISIYRNSEGTDSPASMAQKAVELKNAGTRSKKLATIANATIAAGSAASSVVSTVVGSVAALAGFHQPETPQE